MLVVPSSPPLPRGLVCASVCSLQTPLRPSCALLRPPAPLVRPLVWPGTRRRPQLLTITTVQRTASPAETTSWSLSVLFSSAQHTRISRVSLSLTPPLHHLPTPSSSPSPPLDQLHLSCLYTPHTTPHTTRHLGHLNACRAHILDATHCIHTSTSSPLAFASPPKKHCSLALPLSRTATLTLSDPALRGLLLATAARSRPSAQRTDI
jgi:hypothetical protein